jgi:hypothetical protein
LTRKKIDVDYELCSNAPRYRGRLDPKSDTFKDIAADIKARVSDRKKKISRKLDVHAVPIAASAPSFRKKKGTRQRKCGSLHHRLCVDPDGNKRKKLEDY